MEERGVRFRNKFLAVRLHAITNIPFEVDHERRAVLRSAPVIIDGSLLDLRVAHISDDILCERLKLMFLALHISNILYFSFLETPHPFSKGCIKYISKVPSEFLNILLNSSLWECTQAKCIASM